MNKLLSPNFWVMLFINTFFTMCCIYAIKVLTAKFNIPVVSTIAESV